MAETSAPRWAGVWRITPRRLCLMGVLLAMELVLDRLLNIQVTSVLWINLGFLPNAVAGLLMGPFCALLVAACGDLLGALLFPAGAFFPGFTLTSALAGLNYGLWLYRREAKAWRCALCLLPVTLLLNMGLNTCWLWMISGEAALAAFPARALKSLAQYPVNVLLLLATAKLARRLPPALTQV